MPAASLTPFGDGVFRFGFEAIRLCGLSASAHGVASPFSSAILLWTASVTALTGSTEDEQFH